MKVAISLDIMDIKLRLHNGRLRPKINEHGSILLEDTQTCEVIQLMQLPEGYDFRPKAKWEPQFIYTYNQVDNYMQGREGWACSECGWATDERHDYCVCGADMRESNRASKISKEFKELIEKL